MPSNDSLADGYCRSMTDLDIQNNQFGAGTPQHGLSSNKMALITSDCGAMHAHGHQMALITSECVPAGGLLERIYNNLDYGNIGESCLPAAIPTDNPYCSCGFQLQSLRIIPTAAASYNTRVRPAALNGGLPRNIIQSAVPMPNLASFVVDGNNFTGSEKNRVLRHRLRLCHTAVHTACERFCEERFFVRCGAQGRCRPSRREWSSRRATLTAAIPMENPYCSCRLTRARPRCSYDPCVSESANGTNLPAGCTPM